MENFENIRLPWPECEIVKYLGGGAYGKVYEIERNNSGIREKAAVKIVSRPKEESELEADYQNGYDRESIAVKYTEILQEYINEYKLMKELQGQSNIVSCDDFALEKNPNGIGGKIYIRMELLTPLQKVTKERLLSEKEVIKLGKDICKALILCESRNIIHRDIKPDNIMISKFGDYKLGDFGVSKVMSHTTGATMTGTEGYMAPEVLHIEKYGKEVDIYSLGIVMYWLLNNRRMPFIGADEKVTLVNANQAAMRRYHGEKIPAPKNGSDELKKIVLKACEYRPKDRYLTAQEMYDALEEIGSGKSYTKNTVSGYQAEPSSGDEWMENGETVGKTEGGFSGGQTAGNSWGGGGTIGRTIGITIGKLKGNTEKKQKEVQEEPKTIGVKKAYQEQKKKVEEAKKVAAEKKEKAKKEVTAQTYQKRLKKTVFGYLWEIFILGFCVVFLFRTIQIGTFKENPIAILALIAGIAIPEALDFIMERIIDPWKFFVDGFALSSIYLLIVYYLFDKNLPNEAPGVFIFGVLMLVVLFGGGKIINKFTYVLVNEPVEKSDNKSKIAKYKQVKVVVIVAVCIGGVLLAKNILWEYRGSIDYTNYKENVDDNGNVVRRTYYYTTGRIGEIREYDENGKMTKKTDYDTDGKSICWVIEYNENEEEIKWSSYDEGKVSFYETYEYDEKGNKIKETHYDENDKVGYVIEYEYDENGNNVKWTDYDGEGQLRQYMINEYDSDNEKTKETSYDSEGNVKDYRIYEKAEEGKFQKWTKFDANGNVISESK